MGGEREDGACVDLRSESGPTLRCQLIVAVPAAPRAAGQGDSGSPVFHIIAGSQVELRGMLWGGTGNCFAGSDGVLSCDHFIASNLGGIERDLDPSGNAPLTYFSTVGGGSEPEPCEPQPGQITCDP